MFKESYPNLALLIDKGFHFEVNNSTAGFKICSISRGDRVIVAIAKGRQRVDAVFARLEELARAYVEDDWIHDEISGAYYQVV